VYTLDEADSDELARGGTGEKAVGGFESRVWVLAYCQARAILLGINPFWLRIATTATVAGTVDDASAVLWSRDGYECTMEQCGFEHQVSLIESPYWSSY
jgi:hypothetical protein